jgi:NTP pyrophosphatase (non-canonical NTP hydrolase)
MNGEITPFTSRMIDQIASASKSLKESFKSTEKKEWDPSNLASELLFQTTHLINAVICQLRPEDAQTIGPLLGVNKGLEDESADVLFNIMNLANSINVSVSECIILISPEDSEKLTQCIDPLILSSNLVIQVGELWDAIFRKLGYKHMVRTEESNDLYIRKALGSTYVSLINLTNYLGIDLFKAFSEMHKDASYFLDQYKPL